MAVKTGRERERERVPLAFLGLAQLEIEIKHTRPRPRKRRRNLFAVINITQQYRYRNTASYRAKTHQMLAALYTHTRARTK